MTLNRFMHPENPFRVAPDFKALALKYPEFMKHVSQDVVGKIHLDFKNPDALRELSKTLLLDSFSLRVDIPAGCLIPTIPSRLNYLLWIKDLIKVLPPAEKITGIDIGTGACAVYPLLGARELGWSILGTESDAKNISSARLNVEQNNLQEMVELVKVENNMILNQEILNHRYFTFSMCNPPFFNREDVGEAPGKDCEVKTQGGEVNFIFNMAEQSSRLKTQVQIFTTLLGHKSSLAPVKKYLKNIGVKSISTTEFCQGRTMRWGVAWTFLDLDLTQVISIKAKKGKEKPFSWSLPSETVNTLSLLQTFKTYLTQIQVDIELKKETKHFCSARLSSKQTLWRNQRQQRRKRRLEEPAETAPVSQKGAKFSEILENTGNGDSSVEQCLLDELLWKNSGSCLNSKEIDSPLTDKAKINGHAHNNSDILTSHDSNATSNAFPPLLKTDESFVQKNRISSDQKSDVDVDILNEGSAEPNHVGGTEPKDKGGSEPNHEGGREPKDKGGSEPNHEGRSEPNHEGGRESGETVLECDLVIRLSGAVVQVEVAYKAGQAGRDAAHQLLQFLKNKYNNPS